MSAISKVPEKLISANITEHLTNYHLMCALQFGSLKHYSTAKMHLLMSSSWSQALDTGQRTIVLALGFEDAFDRVWHKAQAVKLLDVDMEG